MGSEVVVEPSRNKADIMHVIKHPSIWSDVGGRDDLEFDFDFKLNEVFIIGRVDGVIIGCAIFHNIGRAVWKIHYNVIAEFRKRHSSEFFIKMSSWFKDRAKPIKLVASIPDEFPNVQDFAELHGFERKANTTTYELVY